MAVKDIESDNIAENKNIYSIPFKSLLNNGLRNISITEAKQAFLNATINESQSKSDKKETSTIHYAQIAITTGSEDSRITGGGYEEKTQNNNNILSVNKCNVLQNINKNLETQPRKITFKTKNASFSCKRPPMVSRPTLAITKTKVSELTKKFNELVAESPKSLNNIGTVSHSPNISNKSTSTLTTNPNVKIILRQSKGSRKRNIKKRCSSMDSIDKYPKCDKPSAALVIRSKSDGSKEIKSAKKRSKNNLSEQSGSDSVDDDLKKGLSKVTSITNIEPKKNLVKNFVEKFECGITQINSDSDINKTLLCKQEPSKNFVKEKPKVPEKKSSLVVTKNLVVKDGVPKIRTIKSISTSTLGENKSIANFKLEEIKKKQSPYDKNKYKTNYIHSDKLPLHVVEIIHDVGDDNSCEVQNDNNNCLSQYDETSLKKKTSSPPNKSFLWRRKSCTMIYSENETTHSESCHDPFSLSDTEENKSSHLNNLEISKACESQNLKKIESLQNNVQITLNCDPSSDFESNLVEAYNKDILVNYSTKPKNIPLPENDYEVLEPRDIENVVVIPVNVKRSSKINCPLPEIPKHEVVKSAKSENIYQSLLEMRSHPEGDESSIHSYELYGNQSNVRTRGDGDSDDGYEYCKSPIKPYCLASNSGIQITEDYNHSLQKNNTNFEMSKSVSGTSTVSYEKNDFDRIYEKIPSRSHQLKELSSTDSKRHSIMSDCTGYNIHENIYDTIKQNDAGSISNCYESIPNSPSMLKFNSNLRRQLTAAMQKRLSFDSESNISQSTLSSEQKTNSIYGQRSVLSYGGQEIAFQVPNSETSVSDKSDRSDEWVDISDEEKHDKVIVVREKSRGKKSPISWSQKVRHQRGRTRKEKYDDEDCDSSDSGHVYESLDLKTAPSAGAALLEDDFDSFDSDTDSDDNDKTLQNETFEIPPRLPTPPTSGGQYTLTKIANAAQRKMREIKRNLTKRYSVAMDGNPFSRSTSTQKNGIYENDAIKNNPKSPIYANCEIVESQQIYSKINSDASPASTKTEPKINGSLNEELKVVFGEKRNSHGDVAPPITEKPTTPTTDNNCKKEPGTLSRKTYLSFKSRFRRATSLAVDMNDVPGPLKITNSTFYLTDSVDGDSGFSNCSDNGQVGSIETLSPSNLVRRRDGTRTQPAWAESTPCLTTPPAPPIVRHKQISRPSMTSPCPTSTLTRPTVPPPPPPTDEPLHHTDLSAVNEELKRQLPNLLRKEKTPRSRTSWYAECGPDTPSTTASWYSEAGLYQTGNISTSSGASSGSHPASPLPHSLFTHEPLYQFYNAEKVQSACRGGDSDSDAYEPNASAGSVKSACTSLGVELSRPSAMALVAPRGPSRTLWSEVPEVVNSAVLSSLASTQKRLQEAKFELLTSEASYLNSLNVLESHFISHPAFRDPQVLPRKEWEKLFATILPVRRCSQLLMNELEKCWQENILLTGISDIVQKHAEKHFGVYVKYCENQALMVRTLQWLRERPAFANALRRLESHPACQSLSLQSFLMLPMQRVTRLPLLMDALLKNLGDGDAEYDATALALSTLNHFVSQCNEGARNTERIEEMYRLAHIIEFPTNLRDPPVLGPACGRRDRRPVRWLVRSGEMTHLVWKTDEMKLTFGKKYHKVQLHLFLFNDLLVIAKKKSGSSFVAVDHCPRSLLEVCSSDVSTATAKHALLLTLLENHEGHTVEMLMSCASETELSRWHEALCVGKTNADGEGEAVYAGWDCPQVAALYAYAAAQPDELALAEGDVVNVTRKTAEGWYYGERTRDGESGWFPGSYTVEIASAHVRARNLRQRYRLLALSGTYRGHPSKKRPI